MSPIDSPTSLYPKRVIWFAYFNIFVVWGSTFLAISYGLKGFPPFVLSGLRYLTAGILLFVWRLSRGDRSVSRGDWTTNTVSGFFILALGTGLVTWAEQYVSSTEASIVTASGPFWFIALDKKRWRYYFERRAIVAGLVVGFAGLLLFLSSSLSVFSGAYLGYKKLVAFGALMISSVSWVTGALYSRSRPTGTSTFMNTAQQLLSTSAVCMIVATMRGEWRDLDWSQIPAASWLGLLFLIIMGSIITYLSYIFLLTVRNPAQVSTHTFINPIVAAALGWLFTGEGISWLQGAGLLVILIGVGLTNRSSSQEKRATGMARFRPKISLYRRIPSNKLRRDATRGMHARR